MGSVMKDRETDSDYPQDEAEKRRDDLLGNLMRMPPKPRPKRDREEKKRDAETPRSPSSKKDDSEH